MNHPHAGNAAPYVLDALEPGEAASFESHLSECAPCRADVASFQPVLVEWARLLRAARPDPALRRCLLAAIAEPPRLSGALPPGAAPAPERRRAHAWLPLAATLCLAAFLGLYSLRLQSRIGALGARLADAERRVAAATRDALGMRQAAAAAGQAVAVLAAPDLARIDLHGEPPAASARARALWSRARGMVFVASGLPPLPAGRVYQVWVVTAAAPVSAGLLDAAAAAGGVAHFATPPDMPAPAAVAVTVEPAGGRPSPTGERVLLGTPAPVS